jgi:hypothetical protein
MDYVMHLIPGFEVVCRYLEQTSPSSGQSAEHHVTVTPRDLDELAPVML